MFKTFITSQSGPDDDGDQDPVGSSLQVPQEDINNLGPGDVIKVNDHLHEVIAVDHEGDDGSGDVVSILIAINNTTTEISVLDADITGVYHNSVNL